MSPESLQTWLNAKPDRREPWHDERYVKTLGLLQTLRLQPKSALDIGQRTIFTDMASWALNIPIKDTGEQDCRYPFETNNSGNKYDVIFCLEVLEHIHDLPAIGMLALERWTGSGQLGLLYALRHFMSNDSLLILTTPNACGPRPLKRWLNGERPMFFDLHVRELTQREVVALADAASLEVAIQGGWTLWDSLPSLAGCNLAYGNSLAAIDDLWFVFRKKQ